MKKTLGIAALLLGSSAYGQTPNPILIENTGVVRAGQEVAHANNSQVVRWGLAPGANSWYVLFAGNSPCAGGAKEFGSEAALPKTCTVQNAPVGSYKYSTSDRRGGTMHDPVIIIDN